MAYYWESPIKAKNNALKCYLLEAILHVPSKYNLISDYADLTRFKGRIWRKR